MDSIISFTGGRIPLKVFQGALRPVAAGILIAIIAMHGAQAEDIVEFNTDVLDVKERGNIDLGRFSQVGYLMPGKYQFVVIINKAELPEQPVEYLVPADDPKASKACLTAELVKQFGLKEATLKKVSWWHNGQCLDIASLEGMTVTPNSGNGTLSISIPQAYLEYTADNWDPSSRWDDGIPGLLFDYNVNAMSSHAHSGGDDNSVSGNGVTGANFGPWRLRADWQSRYERADDQGTQKSWEWSRYYLYRAITSLRAKMVLGENSLDSSIFDSFRFSGVSLTTDDNQLPPNLRGYAPEVAGVAKTNAKVTISQQGRVIYETTVAAGPFRIQDINSAVSGKLDVKVEEQDGSTRIFQVDTASIPYLTRPGLVRYKFSAGKPSDSNHHMQGPEFGTGEFSWGINNGWSLYGGALLAGDYNALSLGIGRDLLAFGAVSADITTARAKLPGEGTISGNSYRLSYSKRFDEYDSQVTFAGYRFSERNFMNMSEYLDRRYGENYSSGSDKELYTITLNKQFSSINLSAYLNFSHQTYWDRRASDSWNLSLSQFFDIGRFKNVSVSLTAYRTKYDDSSDDGVYLGVTLPWGDSGTLNYNGQFSDQNSNMVGYYDRINSNTDYRINAGSASGDHATGNGYITHDGDIATMTANASYTDGEYNAVGMSLQGGMTMTGKGAALHRTNTPGGTRMLVDTEGVGGVPIQGGSGAVHTNAFGKAIVSDISSYYRSSINVDLNALPENVDATRSVVQGTLTEGAIGYRRFGILAGEKAMAVVKLTDGTSPPFGAEVRNQEGTQTGIIGDGGQVWLAGIQPGEQMNVIWDDGVQCRILLPSAPPSPGKGLLLPCNKA
ncbi:TPA: outer membrane usher protein [Citrobacter farmeri]|nr:outer membrane usher protein [Citrobacter farmeri]